MAKRIFPPSWYAKQAARRKTKYKSKYEHGYVPPRWKSGKSLLKLLDED